MAQRYPAAPQMVDPEEREMTSNISIESLSERKRDTRELERGISSNVEVVEVPANVPRYATPPL